MKIQLDVVSTELHTLNDGLRLQIKLAKDSEKFSDIEKLQIIEYLQQLKDKIDFAIKTIK